MSERSATGERAAATPPATPRTTSVPAPASGPVELSTAPAAAYPADGLPADRLPADRRRELDRRILEAARTVEHPLGLAQRIRPLAAHWGHAYCAALARWLAAGGTIAPVRAWFERDGAPAADGRPTLYLRHDVHGVGVPGGLAMIDLEAKIGVASTWYLTWEYRRSDRRHRGDYESLGRLAAIAGDGVEYGLHEGVLDEALFRTRLGGEEDPGRTKEEAERIVREDGLFDRDPRELFARGADGIWRLRPLDEVRSVAPRLAEWVEVARGILAERVASFRDHFGRCDTINGHGGYAFMRLRELGGLPAEGSFQLAPPFDGEAAPSWRMLWQSFRMLEDADGAIATPAAAEGSTARPRFLETALHRTMLRQGRPDGDLWDGVRKSPAAFLAELDAAIAAGGDAFLLIHPDVWSAQHMNALADLVVEGERGTIERVPPGPARHALHRTALMRRAHRHHHERRPDWVDDEAELTDYCYRFGHFEDRARRLLAVVDHVDGRSAFEGGTLIDLGGGSGTLSTWTRAHLGVARTSVHDLDEDMLAFLRTILDDLGLDAVASARAADFRTWKAPSPPDGPADVLMSVGALEFLPRNRDIRRLFAELGRAVRSGGLFVCNVWNHHYRLQGYSHAPLVQHLPLQRLRLLAARRLGKEPWEHFRSLSHRRWRRGLAAAGYEDVRLLYCLPTRDGFAIRDVDRSNRGRYPHVWITGRRR